MRRYYSWDERPCQVCGASLKGKRGDAKYCSVNCRKQASRWAAALNGYASDIAFRIRGLEPYLHHEEQRFRARGVLQELQSQIQSMLNVTHRLGTDKDGQSDV